MSIEPWKIIASINTHLNSLREADSPAAVARIDLVELRGKLRTQLEHLRAIITTEHSERDAYFVLFPLTAHCDELVKKVILDISHLSWPPLQQELYQVEDAGDLFYELLDNALGKPETLPLVYQVYYFCLNDGFCGRHGVNPDRLADYLERLRSHITLPAIEDTSPNLLPAPPKWLHFRIPNRVYYGSAVFLLILVYFGLTSLASTWQPSGSL